MENILYPKNMELPDAAYGGPKLAKNPRYGKPCGSSQLAKTLAVYDRSDPRAARVIIVVGSDFERTSPKLFWPETLVYPLPGAGLNQMLALVVAIKSEAPCEPELLLFAGMNDHLHAAGLLEHLRSEELRRRAPVRPDERGASVGGFSIWTQDEIGFYDIPGLREHAACHAVCVCNVGLDSGRERVADTYG